MTTQVEAVKRSGAKQAIFEKISRLLWTAKYSLELAAQHDGGTSYKNFNAKVSDAKRAIAEAEEFNAELIKISKKP